jgi:hypothetical protein
MIKNESAFFWAVQAMRKSQKEYFKNRNPIALYDAKAAEKLVDDYIDRHIADMTGTQQGELYK